MHGELYFFPRLKLCLRAAPLWTSHWKGEASRNLSRKNGGNAPCAPQPLPTHPQQTRKNKPKKLQISPCKPENVRNRTVRRSRYGSSTKQTQTRKAIECSPQSNRTKKGVRNRTVRRQDSDHQSTSHAPKNNNRVFADYRTDQKQREKSDRTSSGFGSSINQSPNQNKTNRVFAAIDKPKYVRNRTVRRQDSDLESIRHETLQTKK